jgi:hypothetical protein
MVDRTKVKTTTIMQVHNILPAYNAALQKNLNQTFVLSYERTSVRTFNIANVNKIQYVHGKLLGISGTIISVFNPLSLEIEWHGDYLCGSPPDKHNGNTVITELQYPLFAIAVKRTQTILIFDVNDRYKCTMRTEGEVVDFLAFDRYLLVALEDEIECYDTNTFKHILSLDKSKNKNKRLYTSIASGCRENELLVTQGSYMANSYTYDLVTSEWTDLFDDHYVYAATNEMVVAVTRDAYTTSDDSSSSILYLEDIIHIGGVMFVFLEQDAVTIRDLTLDSEEPLFEIPTKSHALSAAYNSKTGELAVLVDDHIQLYHIFQINLDYFRRTLYASIVSFCDLNVIFVDCVHGIKIQVH